MNHFFTFIIQMFPAAVKKKGRWASTGKVRGPDGASERLFALCGKAAWALPAADDRKRIFFLKFFKIS